MSFKVGMLCSALVASLAFAAVAQEASSPDRVELMKESFAASKKALRSYQWIQTVGLSLGGEEKAKQQYTCYYGAEGNLQKVPVAADAKEDKKRGLRGKVVESKKAELEGSLKSTMALLDQYTPIEPAKIEAAKAAGNVSVSVPDQSGRVRVTIKNYLKPGDEVEVAVDGAKNTLKGVKISSMLEDKSPVTATVTYASLADGTQYPDAQALDLKSQKLSVNVKNSGYKKQSP
jgi:hypothetical protein